jgi:hypothetical protein
MPLAIPGPGNCQQALYGVVGPSLHQKVKVAQSPKRHILVISYQTSELLVLLLANRNEIVKSSLFSIMNWLLLIVAVLQITVGTSIILTPKEFMPSVL